jgi:NADPH-dependent glutamate synthase beta subunit-like oxidoreductase/ferredoxin
LIALPPVAVKENVCYICGTDATTANRTGEWRYLTPERVKRLSPCRYGCLLDGPVPEWLEALKKEDWAEAWQIMKKYNPFPALTGYVCFHPCTENCNRSQLDQEIDIPGVEKAIGNWRLENFRPGQTGQSERSCKGKVAVVGSGPAGLSCAFYLAEAGYDITVFEKENTLGGMLSLGIPEYRLPGRILKQELAVLTDMGIKFVTGCALGRDFSLDDLYRDYTQVFLATGAWVARKANIPGEDSLGIWNALEFLKNYNLGKQLAVEGPVVVIGGGNAAVDSARAALRLPGVHHVSLIYRRSRVEMPADQTEVEAAEREGVELIFNAAPRALEGESGKVRCAVFDYCRTGIDGLLVDSSKPVYKECGTVIMALGQNADFTVIGPLNGSEPVFAGGDLVSGPATVPAAIRAGRIAAESIRAELEGLPKPQLYPNDEQVVLFEELNLAARVNINLQEKQNNPVTEAGRCLGCGTCNSCGVCYLFCPDLAIDSVDGRYEFNLDYCKGCGICVRECPSRALVMEGGG